MLKLTTALLVLALTGCATIKSDPVEVVKLKPLVPGARQVTIVGKTPYLAEMTIALAKNGIELKPEASEETVSTQVRDGASSQRRMASTRYGLDIQFDPTRQVCLFTDHRLVNAKATVIDLTTNTAVAVVSQRGSDGPCSTVDPVFPGMAKAISDLLS